MLPPKYFLLVIAVSQTFLIHAQHIEDLHTDTASIDGKIYIGQLDSNGFYLRDKSRRLLLKVPNRYDYYSFEFKDFNGDGYKDLQLNYSSNTPYVLDMFIFIPSVHKFRKIRNFKLFPAPIRIKGTPYFYSYHKSGCADMNWDSDLFYIHNNIAVALGNISGRQCDNRDEKDGIYIHCMRNGKRTLISTLPIQRIWEYKDFKWGFISAYWTKHYKRFI